MSTPSLLCLFTFLILINACSQQEAPSSVPSVSTQAQSLKANTFFDQAFDEIVARSPQYQTFLGLKTNNDKWDDISDAHEIETITVVKKHLTTLQQSIDYKALDKETALSYRLFVYEAERKIASFKYRHHHYPLNQMYGIQAEVASFLINFHRVDNKADLEAYIKRLKAVAPLFDQLIVNLKQQADKGIIVPKFIFPHLRNDCLNILSGAPFDNSEKDSTLLADFKVKLNKLTLSENEQQQLLQQASAALNTHIKPAYQALLHYLDELEALATNEAGVWKLPNGDQYYEQMLRNTTTTDLNPDQIHQLGLDEVARIHQEMQQIMQTVKFNGKLQQFFTFMREDKQFFNDNTASGRSAYLQRAENIVNNMRNRLDQLFITQPKADLEVKAVEAFREKSAGKAFYSRPAPDGSRPGIFYANLYDMNDMPTYELEALAYHEAIPGHHMQLAIAIELENIPKFRQHGSFTAFIEGWGLYSEYIGKEMGFYQDPYSDFGRLSMELWRACRLVVDTGIHAKRWTREQAIQYLDDNTPSPHEASVKAIERYSVLPSQATAYKIGMLEIQSLRKQAEQAMGTNFDIREYHDLVLRGGALPLDLLKEKVHAWINTQARLKNTNKEKM